MATSGPHGTLVGQRFGKFDLLALLAVGGTAEIYLARIAGEAGFEKYVVCKCLLDHLADQPEYVNMFLDEARIGAQLDHSNIVQTLELGEQDGRYYMVMEYLAGMSLSTMAKKAQERVAGGLPIDLTLALCAMACAGLHYAHERTSADGKPLNIIHRDVSPQNLVVSFEGVLKLVDFGIAKAEMRETHTKSGTIKGKFAYMSPEQCLGHPLDRRTDIFSLGTILHELLTGHRLFKRNNTYDTYHAIVNHEVVPPSQVNHQLDPALDDLVMRALAYDRAGRYPTAEAFGEALLQMLHRRGKSVGASDVARFFDQHFASEIDTHAARMRELVTSGRATMQDISWHAPELASDSASQMPDELPPARAPTDATMDESPSTMDDEWTADVEAEGGGDAPADEGGATRIEPNPLLRVQTMHAREMKKKGQPAGGKPEPAGKQRVRTARPTNQGYRQGGDKGAAPRPAAGRPPTGRPGGIAPGPADDLEAPTVAGHTTGKPAPVGRATLMMPGVPMPTKPSPPGPRPGRPASAGLAPKPTARAASAPAPAPMARPAEPSRPASAPIAQPSQPSQPAAAPAAQPSQPSQPTAAPSAQPAQPSQPAPAAAKPEQSGPADSKFPPLHTPTAFRQRGDLIDDEPHPAAPGDDLFALSHEPRTGHPTWLLAVAFLVSAGVGLGATLLVAKLVG